MTTVQIPPELLPVDGRFGCGPSKVRPAHVAALAAVGETLLGTSHRQAPVRSLVARVREGIADLLEVPEGYEVVLGNGGTTAFWDAAVFGLIEEKSQHLEFGEFSSKFAQCARRAPFLADPTSISAEPGGAPEPVAEGGVQESVIGSRGDHPDIKLRVNGGVAGTRRG